MRRLKADLSDTAQQELVFILQPALPSECSIAVIDRHNQTGDPSHCEPPAVVNLALSVPLLVNWAGSSTHGSPSS
ncbi:hypothetical protein HZ326_19768 [Fusarium oxysporum f. sp. albedinis]|nr:hypothetical protein HZ326_19768 [Fusarium oxysporum f. sp. albedinis]